ncbi:MAG: tRNA (adenosine(37)-N6)-threonylcarbamoyltransferase complex ATPase subunit type 1 TsaE, partial [Bdellovibrionales bacterium]|nr:tRNA (adenosine(37)-N6)-threonylcarbamoyltransferase complex ATPase subunit type 1 TsaE [Bdellovibrionales bacterium]NQZ19457.1 tRNA (adenosine(37)-N6)-threonylcarbamoyltransferase complex ATPase subunit type 1 TsaE [Bdellovibrionales bacterium]
GKTELVKELVKALGGQESSSPTYSLINEYALMGKSAYHVDLYRIESEDDLESVGFWDLFDSDEGLIFIEWASRLNKNQLPLSWSVIEVEVSKLADDQQRVYKSTQVVS